MPETYELTYRELVGVRRIMAEMLICLQHLDPVQRASGV